MGRPNRQKPRRKFTPEEIAQLEAYASIRLPTDYVAAMFGISDTWLEQLIKDNDAAQLAVRRGRAKSSANYRQTLYQMAVVEKNPRMIEFWGYTQEGFKKTEVVEHAGSIQSGLAPQQLQQLFQDPESLELARALAERLIQTKPDDESK
jgi:hypothetical protein